MRVEGMKWVMERGDERIHLPFDCRLHIANNTGICDDPALVALPQVGQVEHIDGRHGQAR